MKKQEEIPFGVKTEKTITEDNFIPRVNVSFIQVKFGLNFTEDELLALAKEPHSKLAIKTKQYIYKCIKYAAEQYAKGNNVTEH